jgi:hypothetical protein
LPTGELTSLPAGVAAEANPFEAGPYARWEAALGIGRARGVRRAVIAGALAWLPLAALAATQGLLLRANPRESLLLDLTAYARYLLAVPLLIAAEDICLPLLGAIARQFVDAGLIAERQRARYEAVVASARRLLAHRGAELGLLVAAYAVTALTSPVLWGPSRSTWIAPVANGERALSLAGWWSMLVSQPLFLLLVGAWLWRVVVWTRLLWHLSRLDLQLVPAHPDLSAGLYFTSTSLRAFSTVALPLSAAFAGAVAEAVLYGGWAPAQLEYAVPVICVALTFIFAAPLSVFAAPLRRARLRGIFEYGKLAMMVGRLFEERWIRAGAPIDAGALSAQDFSATIDLYFIAGTVQQMRLVPLGFRSLTVLVAATLLPFVPVVLAVLPLRQLAELVRRMLF